MDSRDRSYYCFSSPFYSSGCHPWGTHERSYWFVCVIKSLRRRKIKIPLKPQTVVLIIVAVVAVVIVVILSDPWLSVYIHHVTSRLRDATCHNSAKTSGIWKREHRRRAMRWQDSYKKYCWSAPKQGSVWQMWEEDQHMKRPCHKRRHHTRHIWGAGDKLTTPGPWEKALTKPPQQRRQGRNGLNVSPLEKKHNDATALRVKFK